MDDIASELGISKSTVSRALAGSGRISGDTIEKVEECAKKLGFRPNPVAKALAGRKTLNIAAVMPSEATGAQVMFFHECLNGIVTAAEMRGYSVLVCLEDEEGKSLGDVLEYGKVDALVLMQLRREDRNLEILRDSGVPFVVIGSGAGSSVVQVDSRVVENCADFTYSCLSRRLEAGGFGDERILFVCGTLDVSANSNRLLGFLTGMERFLLEKSLHVNYAVCTDVSDFESDGGMDGWSVVLCSDDVVCVNVLKILRRNGIQVGPDVKIASFHDSILLESASPPVTALHVDAFALGSKAAEGAVSLAEGRKVEGMTYVDCSVEMRESL